jgi:serine protease Do
MGIRGTRLRPVLGLCALATAALTGTGCPGGGSDKLSQKEIVDKDKPMVVRLQGKEGGGSGVVVDADRGLVLTNAHVANGLTGGKAIVGDDPSTETPVQLVAATPCEDLAVMRLVNKPTNLKAIDFGSSKDVSAGDQVTTLGYPSSAQETKPGENLQQASNLVATFGAVSSANIAATIGPDDPRFNSVIQHQATSNPGNSGGPLVNQKAKLIGINTFGTSGTQGGNQNQSYAISVDRIKTVLPGLENGHSEGNIGWDLVTLSEVKPQLPAIFADDPNFQSAAVGRLVGQKLDQPPVDDGMYVASVQPGSAADKAHFQFGDLIEKIDGEPVTTVQDVCDIVESKGPGSTMSVAGVYINSASDTDTLLQHYSQKAKIPRT